MEQQKGIIKKVSKMKALIFNSGLGKRMGEFTNNNHKSMAKMENGETILERQIRILSECGITDFVITIGPFQDQIFNICNKYSHLNFKFVENSKYQDTNYIYSMYLAREYLDDDFLLLHGDLVFNKRLVRDLLKDSRENIATVYENRELPEKDFKCRLANNKIIEISVNIFGENCRAFQPLYKLNKETLGLWNKRVNQYIDNGNDKVYAENALNEITDELNIEAFYSDNYFIDEVDTLEDLNRVKKTIRDFDFSEQEIYVDDIKIIIDILPKNLKKILVVCNTNVFIDKLSKLMSNIPHVFFTEFNSNPVYEEVMIGLKLFKENNCDAIISIGGGSSIDVAKAIKYYNNKKADEDIEQYKYTYANIKHIAIPTTAGTGSESTRYAVIYYNGDKLSLTNDSLLPDKVILDSNLVISLPDYQKMATLSDAIGQCIESYLSINSTDQSKDYAKKGLYLLIHNYKKYLESSDYESAKQILIGANYSGKAINISQTTAAHAMSYKLTSMYDIAHGHAVLLCLPYILQYMEVNMHECVDPRGKDYVNDMLKEINNILGTNTVSETVDKLKDFIKEFNFSIKDKAKMKDLDILFLSVNNERLKNNPVFLSEEAIKSIYIKIIQA